MPIIYVAQIAMGANMNQTLKAIAEAEAHAEFDKLLYRESRDGEIIPEF